MLHQPSLTSSTSIPADPGSGPGTLQLVFPLFCSQGGEKEQLRSEERAEDLTQTEEKGKDLRFQESFCNLGSMNFEGLGGVDSTSIRLAASDLQHPPGSPSIRDSNT